MASRTIPIMAIIAVAVLVGTAGLTTLATGDGSDEAKGGSLFGSLHELGLKLHGGGHHDDPMIRLVETLDLTPDQQRGLENIHQIIRASGSQGRGSMVELHDSLVGQFEQGRIETDEIRRAIDGHVEEIRRTAYAVTDELVPLVNGLDAGQREILLQHLRGSDTGHHKH